MGDDGKTVDVKKVDANDKTLLFWAAKTNQVDEVVLLIESGADVNEYNSCKTPLFMAASNGHLEMVKLLLKNGANPNQASDDGATPLFMAASNGHFEVMKLLLENGANPNQASDDGATPLFMTAACGHLEMVKLLLENGANSNQRRTFNEVTPFFIAARNGRFEVIKLFLLSGVMDKEDFTRIDLLKRGLENPILEFKLGDTLQEGIVLTRPNSSSSKYSNAILNVYMMLALEKAFQFLAQVRQDYKKASAIRDLFDLIYSDINKSFLEHVDNWKSKLNSKYNSMKNQAIIEQHANSFSNGVKSASILIKGFFSESIDKVIERKTKTDTETLIDDLVAHFQLWSGNSNVAENTASSSAKLTNSRGH